MIRIYISGSVQERNIGIGDYGSEEFRMQIIANALVNSLRETGLFTVFHNTPKMTLREIVQESNDKEVDFHFAIHSDAGPMIAEGTTSIYHKDSVLGKKYAQILYDHIAPLSPGRDRGVVPDTNFTNYGFYELKNTRPPAVLIELGFHTNETESKWIINDASEIVESLKAAIFEIFGLEEAKKQDYPDYIKGMEYLLSKGILTDKGYWVQLVDEDLLPAEYVINIIERIGRLFDGS